MDKSQGEINDFNQKTLMILTLFHRMVNVQTQFEKAMSTFSYYSLRDYTYKNDNFKQLTNKMNEKDNEIFYCNFKEV